MPAGTAAAAAIDGALELAPLFQRRSGAVRQRRAGRRAPGTGSGPRGGPAAVSMAASLRVVWATMTPPEWTVVPPASARERVAQSRASGGAEIQGVSSRPVKARDLRSYLVLNLAAAALLGAGMPSAERGSLSGSKMGQTSSNGDGRMYNRRWPGWQNGNPGPGPERASHVVRTRTM